MKELLRITYTNKASTEPVSPSQAGSQKRIALRITKSSLAPSTETAAYGTT